MDSFIGGIYSLRLQEERPGFFDLSLPPVDVRQQQVRLDMLWIVTDRFAKGADRLRKTTAP